MCGLLFLAGVHPSGVAGAGVAQKLLSPVQHIQERAGSAQTMAATGPTYQAAGPTYQQLTLERMIEAREQMLRAKHPTPHATARLRQQAKIKQALHVVFTGGVPSAPSRGLDERVHTAFAAAERLRMRAGRLARRRSERPREVFMCIHGFSSAGQHRALFDVLRYATTSRCLFGSMVRMEPGQTSGGWEMVASMFVEESHDRHDAERSEEAEMAALEGLCDTFGMSVGIDAFEHFMDSRMVTSLERIAAGRCRLGRLATAQTRGGEALEARLQQERQRQAEARAVQELEAFTGAPFSAQNMLALLENLMPWPVSSAPAGTLVGPTRRTK